jgi:hypothetical protein
MSMNNSMAAIFLISQTSGHDYKAILMTFGSDLIYFEVHKVLIMLIRSDPKP